eukprot:gb/GECG01011109.1/.p1 GENE.gb/GECG01011109.1/~~gb/GECG01011109.1/.p1  ORF type:complete len:690 (+),score=118.03 gb/GECG01011109.1/:1-2070(+)
MMMSASASNGRREEEEDVNMMVDEEQEDDKEQDNHKEEEGIEQTQGYGLYRPPESTYASSQKGEGLYGPQSKESETLLEYIFKLTKTQKEKLYRNSWATQTILQALPPLCQQIIMRLLLITAPVHKSFLLRWMKQTKKRSDTQMKNGVEEQGKENTDKGKREEPNTQMENAIERLVDLNILLRSDKENPQTAYDYEGNPLEQTADAISLTEDFRVSVKDILLRMHSTPWQNEQEQLLEVLSANDFPSIEWIEREAAKRWYNVLEFLLGEENKQSPDPHVVNLLLSTELIASRKKHSKSSHSQSNKLEESVDESALYEKYLEKRNQELKKVLRGGPVYITRKGYRFLLEDVGVQLWTFISEYVQTAGARGMAPNDILAFLFRLGYCKLGVPYPVSVLTPLERILLKDLSSLGMVYLTLDHSNQRELFYVTSLAIALTHPSSDEMHSGDSQDEESHNHAAAGETRVGGELAKGGFKAVVEEEEGKKHSAPTAHRVTGVMEALRNMPSAISMELIVEKNFKIFAYTTRELHVSLLSLFAKVDALLPDIVVAKLTRRSVGHALDMGITADQIIHFLSQRVHREMAKYNLSIPNNVEDQLHIWERERTRVKYHDATLLSGFASKKQFFSVRGHCHHIGCLLRSNEENQILVVKPESVQDVLGFMEHADAGDDEPSEEEDDYLEYASEESEDEVY